MEKELKVVINLEDNLTKKMPNVTGSVIKAQLAIEALKVSANLVKSALDKVFDFGKDALNTAVAYEQTSIAFKTMIGNEEKAKNLLKDISKFARDTSFQLPEVQDAAKRLLAYNVEAEDIIPTLKMLGDISGGVGKEKMPQLILAFGQVKAATRLTGMELRQFSEAGVPMLDLLAEKFGKSTGEIQEMVSAGKIGFKDVQDVLIKTTEEGGKFYGLQEKQSKTVGGIWSNIQDGVTRIHLAFMGMSEDGEIVNQGLFDKVKEGSERFKEGMDGLSSYITTTVSPAIVDLLDRFGKFSESIMKDLEPNIRDLKRVISEELKPALDDMDIDWGEVYKILKEGIIVILRFLIDLVKELSKFIAENKDTIEGAFNNWIKMAGFFKDIGDRIWGAMRAYQDFLDLVFGGKNKKVSKNAGLLDIDSEMKDYFKTSAAHGGFIPGSAYQAFPAILHGGERVIPRNATDVNKTQNNSVVVNFNGSIGATTQNDLTSIVQAVKSAINRENLMYSQGAY